MGTNQRKQHLKTFLQKLNKNPILFNQSHLNFTLIQQFILTYFGMCFIQGYKIIQKIYDNIFLLSLMSFQFYKPCDTWITQQSANNKKCEYLLLCIEYKDRINQDKVLRTQKYHQLSSIIQFFTPPSSIQTHILFANNFQYSILTSQTLQKLSPTRIKRFYTQQTHLQLKNEKHGLRIFDERTQGIKLHELVQLLLKGSNIFYNKLYLKNIILHQTKFQYHLHKIINTIYFIIGKQIIQGGYINISVEKWMRKFSTKQFKRFDLLLRNQHNVCIIDWKFSKINAIQRISSNQFTHKNLQYLQLARKQYNAQVSLKFYCFHHSSTMNHHKHTTATYDYNIQNIQINDQQYLINENNEIQIQSDSVEIYQEQQIKQIPNYQPKKNRQFQPQQQHKNKYLSQIQIQSQQQLQQLIFQQNQRINQLTISSNSYSNNKQNKQSIQIIKKQSSHQINTLNKTIQIDQHSISNKYCQSPLDIKRRIEIEDAIQDLQEKQEDIYLLPNKINNGTNNSIPNHNNNNNHNNSNNMKTTTSQPLSCTAQQQRQHHTPNNTNQKIVANGQQPNYNHYQNKKHQRQKQQVNNRKIFHVYSNSSDQQQYRQKYQVKQFQIIINNYKCNNLSNSNLQSPIKQIIIPQQPQFQQTSNHSKSIQQQLIKSKPIKKLAQKKKMIKSKYYNIDHNEFNETFYQNHQCQIKINNCQIGDLLIIQTSPSIEEVTNQHIVEKNVNKKLTISKKSKKKKVKDKNWIQLD